jgi:hypothetical protein
MAFLEMAGLLFYVKGFRYHYQILLVDSVLYSVQDAWASVPIAVANHKIKIITQDVSIW